MTGGKSGGKATGAAKTSAQRYVFTRLPLLIITIHRL